MILKQQQATECQHCGYEIEQGHCMCGRMFYQAFGLICLLAGAFIGSIHLLWTICR